MRATQPWNAVRSSALNATYGRIALSACHKETLPSNLAEGSTPGRKRWKCNAVSTSCCGLCRALLRNFHKPTGPLTIRKGVVNCKLPGAAHYSGQAANSVVQHRQQQRPRLRVRHLACCLLGCRHTALPLERQSAQHICDMRLCYCVPGTISTVFMAPASMHGINVSHVIACQEAIRTFLCKLCWDA